MVHFSRISFDSCFGRSEFGEKLVAYDVFYVNYGAFLIASSSLLVSIFFLSFFFFLQNGIY